MEWQWQAAAGLNVVIAVSYVLICALIVQGLLRTRQLTTNRLAVATAAIFATCAVRHALHVEHLLLAVGGTTGAQLAVVRDVLGDPHVVAVDALGAVVAVTYLGLRRQYGLLLHTPAMFDDAVRAAAEERLHELVYLDQLTGVANRAALHLRSQALPPDDTSLAVLFLDLDGFKAVNDVHGHDAGDRLLREVAQHVAGVLGPTEELFRLGGDEFVVLGRGHAQAAAVLLVARVDAAVRLPVVVRGAELVVGASTGLALGTCEVGVDALLREADATMYALKRARHRVPALLAVPVLP